MAQFRDTAGRTWPISITIATAKQIRDAVGVDILDLKTALGQLADPVTLVDVLYVCCREQCREKSISDEQFGAAFNGTTIQDAADALMEALIDFFPQQASEVLKTVWTTTKATQNQQVGTLLAEVRTERFQEELERALLAVGEPSSGPPGPAESTRTVSASGS